MPKTEVEVVEIDDEREPLVQPYRAKCRFKGCKIVVVVPPAHFRREEYCPNHQLLFRATKRLMSHGFGQQSYVRPLQQTYGLGVGPKTPIRARGKAGRASRKGVWPAAIQVVNAALEMMRKRAAEQTEAA